MADVVQAGEGQKEKERRDRDGSRVWGEKGRRGGDEDEVNWCIGQGDRSKKCSRAWDGNHTHSQSSFEV